MGEFFASGRVIDCILAFMLLEIIALTVLRRMTRRGVHLSELVVSVAAGAALLLSLRAALLGALWPRIALWLIVALAAHLIDLGLRWRAAR